MKLRKVLTFVILAALVTGAGCSLNAGSQNGTEGQPSTINTGQGETKPSPSPSPKTAASQPAPGDLGTLQCHGCQPGDQIMEAHKAKGGQVAGEYVNLTSGGGR